MTRPIKDDREGHAISESTALISNDSGFQRGKKHEDQKFSLTTGSLAFAMLVQSYLLVGGKDSWKVFHSGSTSSTVNR